MSKLTHTDLLNLGHQLGYPLTEDGLCQGFSGMLSQAWLLKYEVTFFKRLWLIESYNNNFKQLTDDINFARQQSKGKQFDTLDDKIKELLEILAFYEGIELYLNPQLHDDLLAIPGIIQKDMDAIYSFTRSKKSEEEKRDVSIALDKPQAFEKQDLINYFQDFEKVFDEKNIIAPMILSNSHHCICLLRDPKYKKWVYVDTNDFQRYPNYPFYALFLNSKELVESLFRSFSCNKQPHLVFNTTLIVESSQQEIFQPILNEFDDKYPLTAKQVKMYNRDKVGLLYLACQYRNRNVVEELLKYDAIQINKEINLGLTPFYIACEHGHLDIVCEFLKSDVIDINKRANDDSKPLYIACQNGHLNIVCELLRQDEIKVNKATEDGATPLYVACENGHLDIVRELLKHRDIDIDKAFNDGASPLYIACDNGYLDIVSALLKQEDILVNNELDNGCTPLHIACENGHLDIVRELLKHEDIEVNKGMNDGTTPFYIACLSPYTHEKKELFELLRNYGANVEKTALDIAIKNNNRAAIEVIQNTNKLLKNVVFFSEKRQKPEIDTIPSIKIIHRN